MRVLARNTKPFYYAVYQGNQMIYRDGMATGEYGVTYDEPVKAFANINAGVGDSQLELYGIQSSDYDRLIVSDDLNLPINVNSVLWVDNLAKVESEGIENVQFDYVVKKVAKSLNVVAIAIKKVNIGD